jgi:serine/threonine protein kinase
MDKEEKIHSKILNTFEIVEKVGEGGNGMVWKVIHKLKFKLCALKKYCDVYENKYKAQRMYREIEILSQLQSHENIIDLFEVIECSDEEESTVYLVLRFMQTDLEKVDKIVNKKT